MKGKGPYLGNIRLNQIFRRMRITIAGWINDVLSRFVGEACVFSAAQGATQQVFDVIRFFGFRPPRTAANLLCLGVAPCRETQQRRKFTDFNVFVL
jgi:hypothetical protein